MRESGVDIAEFLLARIAEDEVGARGRMQMGEGRGTPLYVPTASRVLAECEAKRQIVTEVDGYLDANWPIEQVLRLLSLPYADHLDYDESWRP